MYPPKNGDVPPSDFSGRHEDVMPVEWHELRCEEILQLQIS